MLYDYSSSSDSMEQSQEMEIETDSTNNVSNEEENKGKPGSKGYFMFLGDTVPSFYRRPSSSMEGLLSIIPCGKNFFEGFLYLRCVSRQRR